MQKEEITSAKNWKKRLPPDAQKFLNWVTSQRNKISLQPNSKTGISGDFDTVCPKQLAGKAMSLLLRSVCPWDELQRQEEVATPYNHEILNMPDSLVRAFNVEMGGMSGSPSATMSRSVTSSRWAWCLRTRAEGSDHQAITKQRDLIDDFGDHPNIRINISTDSLPLGYRKHHLWQRRWNGKQEGTTSRSEPSAFNEQQAIAAGINPDINVVTLYHGPTGKTMYDLIMKGNSELAKEARANPQVAARLLETLNEWETFPPHQAKFKGVAEKFPGKVCCQNGRCALDQARCGFGEAPEISEAGKEFFEPEPQYKVDPKTGNILGRTSERGRGFPRPSG